MSNLIPKYAGRKDRYGRCRICQEFGKLTKEHVPPKSAFNNGVLLRHYIDELNSTKSIQWESQEENTNGIYVFSLCEKCNNKTGRWYGSDYVRFVETFMPIAIPEKADQRISTQIREFFPVRVIKQVISMILSTSKPTSFRNHAFVGSHGTSPSILRDIEINRPTKTDLAKIYSDLRRFVQIRESRELPKSVRLLVFAGVGKRLGFQTGIISRISTTSKNVAFAAITGLYPIHWVLVFSGDLDETLLDVTDWSNYGYKEKQTLEIDMPCFWLSGKYPLDFRSPKELYEGHFVNSMKSEGFIPTQNISREQEIEEAVFFARALGNRNRDGLLISKFTNGIFYEFGPINGWTRNVNVKELVKLIRCRLENDA